MKRGAVLVAVVMAVIGCAAALTQRMDRITVEIRNESWSYATVRLYDGESPLRAVRVDGPTGIEVVTIRTPRGMLGMTATFLASRDSWADQVTVTTGDRVIIRIKQPTAFSSVMIR